MDGEGIPTIVIGNQRTVTATGDTEFGPSIGFWPLEESLGVNYHQARVEEVIHGGAPQMVLSFATKQALDLVIMQLQHLSDNYDRMEDMDARPND